MGENIDKGKWKEKIKSYIHHLERQEGSTGRWLVMEELYIFNIQQAPTVLSQRYSS